MILRKKSSQKLKSLYEKAFPANERKPFSLIEKNAENGVMDILSLEENGDFLGLVITALDRDIVLIDYFAVDESKRNGGIGGRALRLIAERYRGRRIFLEIESPDEKSENNAQRIRRKAFYLRNGLKESGILADVYETNMELLVFDRPVTFSEYLNLYKKAMGEEQLKKTGQPKQKL